MEQPDTRRILIAELVGTCVLMLGGPGTAIIAGGDIGLLGIALGFGLSLAIMAYVIGPISGCHINPAVTLGLFLGKKIGKPHAVAAVIGQLVGAVLGGAIIAIIVSGRDGGRGQFAANLYKEDFGYFGLGPSIVAEIVFTGLLVFVVLFTTTRGFAAGFGGLVAGLTLAVIHFASIPVDNTSVNPARSIGAAVFADSSFDALQQLWAFIVFPLIGAAAGWGLFMVLRPGEANAD